MVHIKCHIFVVLLGIILEISVLKAETPKKKESQNKVAYSHLWETKDISAVEVSPDNNHVFVFYRTPQVDSSEDGDTSIWSSRFLIKENYKDSASSKGETHIMEGVKIPRWIPGSKALSYIGQEENGTSLRVNKLPEFKDQKIFETEDRILGYQWAPNGKKIAILVNKEMPHDALKVVYGVDIINVMKIYTLDVNDNWETSNLTPLTADIAVPRTYSGAYSESFAWTPDSQHIVYSYYPLSKEEGYDIGQLDLIHVDTKNNKILAEGGGTNLSPVVSPNGKYVAYITNSLPENAHNPIRIYGTDAARVCIIDLKNNQKQCLAKTPNENPQLVGWKKDSGAVLVVDQTGNTNQIYELGLDGKSIVEFGNGNQALNKVRMNTSGEAIGYVVGDLQTPAEAYVTSVNTFKPQKISSFAESGSQKKSDIIVETMHWKSRDKKFNLEGVFIYPKNAALPLPLMTILNDYSKSAAALKYMGDFTIYPISPLSLVEKGYGVFIPNRRGTDGYGTAFRQGIYKELGGEELQDVLSGIDTLISEKKADLNKLALWGWGYGGYLSAYAMTQTNRFKTVIVASGITNLISQIGTTTEPAILNAIMGEPFWKDWKTWRGRSPISHVKAMKTPTFIQTIEETGYIRRSQSEELFFPLRSRNLPTEMIIYEGQGYTFSNPGVTLMAIQDLEDWLEKYLNLQSASQRKENH